MIDYTDEKTWNLFRGGLTKGVFQLESNLGRAWSKRLAPENLLNDIWHLLLSDILNLGHFLKVKCLTKHLAENP